MRERRNKPRAHIVLDVELSHADTSTTHHKTRNIGLGGMFIDHGNLQESPDIGTMVEINFSGEKPYTMEARVGRVTEEGLALLFGEFNLENAVYAGNSTSKKEGGTRPAILH